MTKNKEESIHQIENERKISKYIFILNTILLVFGFLVARRLGLNEDLKSVVVSISEITADKGYKILNKISVILLWYSLARGVTSDLKLYNQLMVLKANYRKFFKELNPFKFQPTTILILIVVLMITFIVYRNEPYIFFCVYVGISILQHIFWKKYSSFLTKNIIRNFKYFLQNKGKIINEMLIRSIKTFLKSNWIRIRLWLGHFLNIVTLAYILYASNSSDSKLNEMLPLVVSASILLNIAIQEGWIWYKRIIRSNLIVNTIEIAKKYKVESK